MVLGVEDRKQLEALESRLAQSFAADELNSRYYEGTYRTPVMGLAVPPELRMFFTLANWCRTTADSVADRLKMRSFYLPGEDTASAALREGWDANNLDSEANIHHKETLISGRGFVSVGSNEEDPEHPLIQIESARELAVDVDHRHKRIRSAARFYGDDGDGPKLATLYLPNETRWLAKGSQGWSVDKVDEHNLGRVPLVMFLNRRRLGKWDGVSEFEDVKSLVDAAARALTNLQLAQETHSVPQKYVLGMSKGDFVDKSGNPIPAWEAYFNAIWANGNKDAKVGQFAASDLKNFHDTVNHYAQLAASVTGLPTRYFGQTSVNPAAEGAIRADESRLVLNVENKQAEWGDGWGWVMGLYERFRTGEWVEGSRIKTEWFDAGTPTYAQRADALTKMYGNGNGLIPRRAALEELGFSEAKIDRYERYAADEARAALTALEKDLNDI